MGLERGQDLFDVADQCVKRGILGRNQGWKYKYVTPLVLEREVIAWLLGRRARRRSGVAGGRDGPGPARPRGGTPADGV
ncbi:hypothetical protein [Sorangium sp. So ce854]|uniref:hypothetical protein n=1 Tax=Sorangium sp. So ce854 TaxID=3133322 RepID=UPI003F60302F